MEKMTIVDKYNSVRDFLVTHGADAEKIEFIDSRIALTTNKNSKRSDKPTKAQAENAILAEAVMNSLSAGNRYTVSEIQKSVTELSELSNQRATAVVRSLVRVGRLARTEEKGKAYFSLV